MGVYLRAMIICCTEYPKLGTQKITDVPEIEGLWRWVQLEIRIFMIICLFGVLFLGLSMFRRPNNIFKEDAEDDELDIKQDNKDFIRYHRITFQIFCILGALPAGTFLVLVLDNPTALEKTLLFGILAL